MSIQQFENALKHSKRIVFFGGAGVSTESGIPDFRSANGIFMQETNSEFTPEQIISHSFFKRYPKQYFDFHFEKLVYPDAQPNLAHIFLKNLEEAGKDVTVVTQNIDGLHQEAGSTNVLELHGTVINNYCIECNTHYGLDELVRDQEGIPRCPNDGGIVRPDIVMYEEALDGATIEAAIQAISNADMLIVAGTSLSVYPAAGFVDLFRGKHLVVINKTPLRAVRHDAIVFEDSISNVLKKVQKENR
ncbi:NAD-dependent protein deacylase [Macrococcoides caseolyticum]|uniref:NAD-dependent protein deacylase n=1 Tax=Macrococcoides caseolyticum TaxID=69966 RepID=UPI001F36CBA3|nr:NAD-dependent protein deacylase [Macrococcus caseolyticus]MCE4956256.1 NAD-dependent protein deacylase [Macrococcus caseolyticus]